MVIHITLKYIEKYLYCLCIVIIIIINNNNAKYSGD